MRERNSKSFKRTLLLFLLPLLAPLLIQGVFSQVMTKQYVERELTKNKLNLLKQIKENWELIFNELDSLNLNFSTNTEITVELKKILNHPPTGLSFEQFKTLKSIQNFITAPANARPYIHSIYVYLENEPRRFLTSTNGMISLDQFDDRSWYSSYTKRQPGVFFWTEPRTIKHHSFEDTGTEVLTIYRSLYVPGQRGSNGVIVLNIYARYLRQYLNNLATEPDHRVLIVDAANQIVFANRKLNFLSSADLQRLLKVSQSVFVFRAGREVYVTSQLVSGKYHWKYLLAIPFDTFYRVPIELQQMTILLSFCSFLLGLALTYWLTKQNHNQLQNIISIIKSAESGQALPEPPSQIKDEYGFITHNILQTFIEQNYLKVQLSERKYKLRFTELLALQSQINPHFLFNTLETIKWKTIEFTHGPNEVSKMLEEISDILRYSLQAPGQTVPLREELKNTRSYIEIQKTRYLDKFDLIWEYDEPVLETPVIRLILQPLIENAIYHGIKPVERNCLIKVKIYRSHGVLRITVIDNGAGIPAGKLVELRQQLALDSDYTQHVGLFNTNKRLKLIYGEEYGLRIRSKEGIGTAVYLRIPVEEAKAEG